MSRKPHQERTLIVLKPDAVQRSLMGEIVARFERAGLKFTGFKFVIPDEDHLFSHYNKDDVWFIEKGKGMIKELEARDLPVEKEALEYGKDIIRQVVKGMRQAPVLAIVVEGNQAVAVVTKLVGPTEPTSSDVGTIRGDYTIDSYAHANFENRSIRNLIHCSDCVEEAEREIELWFDKDELIDYTTAQERIMYDVRFNEGT